MQDEGKKYFHIKTLLDQLKCKKPRSNAKIHHLHVNKPKTVVGENHVSDFPVSVGPHVDWLILCNSLSFLLCIHTLCMKPFDIEGKTAYSQENLSFPAFHTVYQL